jgi:hypothetical protein
VDGLEPEIRFFEVTTEQAMAEDPFSGGSHRLKVGKELAVDQLADELSAAAGEPVMLVVWAPVNGEPIAEDNQSLVCVSPETVNVDVVLRVINDHVPTTTEADLERVERERVLQRIRDGVTLTPDEVQIALRALVR